MNVINRIKLFIYENKNKIITISALVLVFSLSLTFFVFKTPDKSLKTNDVLVYENSIDEKEILTNEKEYYYVDIKGYVNKPGVYSLEKGSRIVDAINVAGGLKENANTSLLNLSREVFDEMVIIIYSESEISDYQNIEEKVNETKEICTQIIQNDACICDSDLNDLENEKQEEIKSELNDSLKETESNLNDNLSSEKININTASKEELMTLSKIGEVKALAIIEYRSTIGLFKTIDEIKEVSGIGDSLFEAIKDYITV